MQEAAATQTLARQVQAVGEASPRLAGLGKKWENPAKMVIYPPNMRISLVEIRICLAEIGAFDLIFDQQEL